MPTKSSAADLPRKGYVKILLAATFREIAGQKEILQKVDLGITLGELLTTLAKKHGSAFNEIIDPKTGRISSETWVMVNGKSVKRTDIELRANDVVIITVPAGGG